ncbi:MAG: bifunctional DNA-formamidopyrimidine glycosylase/DNA-(apurinic or apyrimidinic site) lyase [Betaproteobacteria bacterium]|nr:bifunctional DNA-formamidopyrimidine glycosylase/DNA-(apurinic or apyrimidinic site) lyase [Betaproteobacteria bacterium]
MPELPEVEVTRRGVEPQVAGRLVTGVEVREARLRWPVSAEVHRLAGRRVLGVARRGKYLLLDCGGGSLILHLGMSGSLRVLPAGTPAGRHEHFDLLLGDRLLRLRDPRRFGAVLWAEGSPCLHPLLAGLGVEPLSREFNAGALHALCRGRRVAIKQLLMDSHCIVGVGNIYASESLYGAGIHPATHAGRLSPQRCARLVGAVKRTLNAAIRAGGSSLRDFVRSDGRKGYFQYRYAVYGRAGLDCPACGAPIKRIVQGQRATYYCARCQR